MTDIKFRPLNCDYKSLLQSFQDIGYVSRFYSDFAVDQKHLILRHDIDLCLDRALSIAKIEAELGLQAEYFILLSSPFYNTLEPVNIARIKEISSLGHNIGLHLELEAGVDLCRKAKFEAGILEEIVGRKVDMVSFHRPTANANMIAYEDIEIEGMEHTYEPRYFRDIGYVSDSRGGWYYGNPLDHDSVKNGRALHLLTHPIWWQKTNSMSPKDTLNSFHSVMNEKISIDLKDNFKIEWGGN